MVAASTDTLGNKVILTPFIAQTLQTRKADEDRERYKSLHQKRRVPLVTTRPPPPQPLDGENMGGSRVVECAKKC